MAKRTFTELIEDRSDVRRDGACGTRPEFETPFDLHPVLHTTGGLLLGLRMMR